MNRNAVPAVIAGLGALFLLGFGLWAFIDAQSFFDQLAPFEPFNAHFLHDIGAFQIGIGATLALAVWRPSDALLAALGGAAIGSAFHAAAHLRDHELGGNAGDPIVFGVLTALLLAGAALRLGRP